MATHITQIGKHKFICGLFWQSLSRPRELVKEAAELARKIDSDLMVLRKDHATAQAGFAQTRDGAKRMTYSLGAAVSKSIALEGANYDGQKQPAHNWLGAFKLPDGMWAYFAVRDANFLPNGDFAGSKEAVLDRLHGDYGLGGWNVVIGDAELEEHGFHNFNAKSILDLIPQKKDGQIKLHRWWALKSIETRITWKPIAAILVAGTVLTIGGYRYWQIEQQKKEQQRIDLAIAEARLKLVARGTPTTLPHPWPTMPVPRASAQACVDRFKYLTAGGWLLDDYICSASSVTYNWTRQDSTIAFLLAQVPAAQIDLSGNRASLNQPLQLVSGSDEKLLDNKSLLEPLLSRLQLMGISPAITKVVVPPAPPQPSNLPLNQQKPVALPDWQSYTFALKTGGLPPTEVATILARPGVRLNKLSYHAGEWSIEGVMYAKLP